MPPAAHFLSAAHARAARLSTALLAALFILFPVAPEAARAEPLRLGGTGTGLVVVQRLLEAFLTTHPGTTAQVLPSLGSSGGIKALLAGALDVAISARDLKDEERAKGAVAVAFARTPFVFATRAAAPAGFSRAELAKLYAGEITVWPDGTPVRILLRPTTDSDIVVLRGISAAMNAAVDEAYNRPGMLEAATDQENADALETVAGAIGFSTLGQIVSEQRRLRVLTLDGVEPSTAAAAAGRYPLSKSLFLVMRAEATPLVRDFAAFVRSPAGGPILEQNGYWTHQTAPGN